MPPHMIKTPRGYTVLTEIANQCFIIHREQLTSRQAESLVKRLHDKEKRQTVKKRVRGLN